MNNAVELRNITSIKGEITLFKDLNALFPKGKASIIMGPSGCGKSTLLKIAAGLEIPDGGQVLIDGKPLHRFSEARMLIFRKSSGFMFQDAALWSNKSVFQNLSLPLEFHYRHLHKEEISRKVKKILNRIGFRDNPDLRPAQLSAGECKMASFARAVITDPNLIFMDSPLISIDREITERIIQIIKDLKKVGKTILISTHNPILTSMVADYLIILKKGVILEAGAFDSVVRSTNKEVVNILTDVLSKTSTYDDDLFDLLNTNDE